MRHAKISTTMEVYAQAGMEKKRVAQRRAVDVLLNREPKDSAMEQSKTDWSRIAPAKSRMLPEIAV